MHSVSSSVIVAARGVVLALLATALALPAAEAAGAPTLAQINQALQQGEADKAVSLLNSLPQSSANLGEVHNLECRVRYSLQQWDAAIEKCEQAVRSEDQNAIYHLWLARALGEKADRASFLSAFSLAKRVHDEFEAAARLGPHNVEALASLGDFYQQAPGVVGGGLDKAEGIASQLDKLDPSRAHLLRAHIAESRKDYGTSEQELKQAISLAAHPADSWTNLASFYKKRQRWSEIDSAIRNCIAAAARDKQAGVALYDGAGVLIESNRDPATAAKMLEEYLGSTSKSEEAPTFEAHVRLAKLKKQLGDTAGAQRERAAALQLAHDYKPALEFKL